MSIIYLSKKHKSRTTNNLSGLLLLLFWYFMKHLLVWLGMNRMTSTRIQSIIPYIIIFFPFYHKHKFQRRPFSNGKNEVIWGFNENNWLGVEISKVGRSSSKRYVGSCFLVRVIYEQVKSIGILNQTIHNSSKGINIMSNKMGGIGQESHII